MIPKRFYPVAARIARQMGRAETLEEASVETVEIAPAEEARMLPVAMLDGDWERIEASVPGSTLDHERDRIRGSGGWNMATTRYVLRDALATPFGVYTRRGSYLASGQMALRHLVSAPVAHRAKGFYAVTSVSALYFGHWLMDALATLPLAAPDEEVYLPVPPGWAHAQAYAEALEIDRIDSRFVHFDELAVVHDVGHNRHRRARNLATHDRVQAAIRRRLGALSPAPGVYLSRGETGASRLLLNEDALIEALRARGYAVVSVSAPLERIWDAVGGVSRVVSIEGSHWAHAYFAARRDALHMIINPADHFHTVFADYMLSTGGRMATVVAPRDGEGYVVDVGAVLRMLDQEAPQEGV